MFKKIFIVTFLTILSFANSANEVDQVALMDIDDRIQKIDSLIDDKNIWIKRYYDYKDFLELESELKSINNKISALSKKRDKASKNEQIELENKRQTIQNKLALVSEIGSSGLDGLIGVEPLADAPAIKNPIAVISGLSYIKENQKLLEFHKNRLKELKKTKDLIDEKYLLLEQRLALLSVNKESKKLPSDLERLDDLYHLSTLLNNSYELFYTALMVQEKKLNINTLQIESGIKKEIIKLISISIIITVVITIGFFVKFIAYRTVLDPTRYFGIRRTINVILFFIVSLILLFNYIGNIVYFVTLLGFISAGIAIAMKDWFMSLLGWLVMVTTGSIKVGDEITVVFNNQPVVADVLEIGLVSMKLFVDVSLNTVDVTRRAGQVIYFPNGLIFTQVIQNLTYSKLKTIWDGVDIIITFDSNHAKAQKIAREIAIKHTTGFMNITRKHYAFLKERFNIRTINHEPRVFGLVDKYGIKITVWYLASSYGSLSLRSLISMEIIDAFNAEEDIKIAYPTYAIGKNGESFLPAEETTLFPS